MELVKGMSRKAREGDGDCVTDFALPYDYDETDHQRDELKRLKRMEGGRKMAAPRPNTRLA